MLRIENMEKYLSGDVTINMNNVYKQLEMCQHSIKQCDVRPDIFDKKDKEYWEYEMKFWERFIEECEARNVIMSWNGDLKRAKEFIEDSKDIYMEYGSGD